MVLESLGARRSNQSTLKEINPEYSLEGWYWSWSSNTLATWCKKKWLIGKDPDAGKDWGQEEKGATEDEMVWWHHQHNGHRFEQTLGESEGWGSLACCSPRVTESQSRLSHWKQQGGTRCCKYLIRRKGEWISFVILFSKNIFRRQHSQEEHGRWQTSLANTNNNFTNPTNLLLLCLAHWIDIGIYYFGAFLPLFSSSYPPKTL